MEIFEKYINYVKDSFAQYEKCKVITRVKKEDREIIIILPRVNPHISSLQYGELGIIFDKKTIEFFGDFMPDDCIDWDENFWKKYTEKEILSFLDKKIAEYKYYITNGYFFVFYNKKGEMVNCISYTLDEDFKNFDYEKMYSKEKFSSDADFNDCKSVTVTNFYGEIVVDNKVLN